MKNIKKLPTLAGLLAAMLAAAPALRADYTDNLLVGWTFNAGSLASDLGSMNATFSEAGIGGFQTTTFNADGTVSLGAGRQLVASAINSTDLPSLGAGFTIWVRMSFDTVSSGSAVFGLINGTAPLSDANKHIDRSATFGLITASAGSSTAYFYGQAENSEGALTALSPGSGFPTVTTGPHYFDIAISVNDAGTNSSTYSSWVAGFGTTSRTFTGGTLDLIDFESFSLGRLIEAAGAAYTFDEVRIYDAVLSDAQLAQISAVAVPEPSQAAVLLGGTGLLVVGFRRKGRRG